MPDVAPPEAEAPAEGAQQEQQPAAGGLSALLTMLTRMLLIYWAVKWFTGGSSSTKPQMNGPQASELEQAAPSSSVSHCIWPLGIELDLDVFVSENINLNDARQEALYTWTERRLIFGDWDTELTRSVSVDLETTPTLRNNGSLYAHILLRSVKFPNASQLYKRQMLTRFHPKRKQVITKNLISGGADEQQPHGEKIDESVNEETPIIAYWHPNVTLNVVNDVSPLPIDQLRQLPHVLEHITFVERSEKLRHFPLLYVNEFWTLAEDVFSHPINDTTKTLPLHLTISPVSMWKFQMMVQLDHSLHMQKAMFGTSENDIDVLKRMLFETNPWLLAITFIVSSLHSIFDFLAFKNDVQFWRERKDLEGLSLRSILLNIGLQAIIFLYLFDSDTSWMILVSNCVGLVIEIWKVRKVVEFSVDRQQRSLYGVLPFTLVIRDKTPMTAKRQQTDEYDREAFRYLSYACFPLVIGYSIYSLVYESHKSWYSWVLRTAVGFVYTFGFMTMTPQLFINYKLKSVAHMPWRTFMYKALNTFIDDLFAFIIKMPTLHRLACFRDDIIFIIYLYQRWIYPVDAKRPNEYGQVAPTEVKEKDE